MYPRITRRQQLQQHTHTTPQGRNPAAKIFSTTNSVFEKLNLPSMVGRVRTPVFVPSFRECRFPSLFQTSLKTSPLSQIVFKSKAI